MVQGKTEAVPLRAETSGSLHIEEAERGGEVRLVEGWHYAGSWEHGGPTSIADVDEAIGALLAGDESR